MDETHKVINKDKRKLAQLGKESSQLEKELVEIGEKNDKVGKLLKAFEENFDFAARRKELDNLYKKIIISDMSAICLIVDPSGQLSKYIEELSEITASVRSEKENDLINQRKQLRYKIRKLLDQKIK